MPKSIRLTFYLLLPLILGGGGLILMWLIAGAQTAYPPVLALLGTIALLLALLPMLFFRFFIHSQIQQGFARLSNGQIKLPNELKVGTLLGDQVESWMPTEQIVQTTVCLHGIQERLHVDIEVTIHLSPDRTGKLFAAQISKAMPQLEKNIQHAIYSASRMDPAMAFSLNGSTLLNEDDEAVLKSKFLSALETISIQGISFPVDTRGLRIHRNVRKERIKANASQPHEEDLDLHLDGDLLKSLGVS